MNIFELNRRDTEGLSIEIEDRILKIDRFGYDLLCMYAGEWTYNLSTPYIHRREKTKVILFHRQLLGLHGIKAKVYFKNHDRLDCRVYNLLVEIGDSVYKATIDNFDCLERLTPRLFIFKTPNKFSFL
jgi:hypothetical protein